MSQGGSGAKRHNDRVTASDGLRSDSLAVCDIDGVVADVRHRLHHLDAPRSWDRFFAAAADDPVLDTGRDVVRELAREHTVVWLTGRPERLRTVTTAWLRQHRLPDGELRMRGDADRRPAVRFKLGELRSLHEHTIAAVLDDDPEVVAAALRAGFPAVLADWVPRAETLAQAQDGLGRT